MRARENALFEQWKKIVREQSDAIFVPDGVVDENAWENTPCKVLYLLKEVNGADSEWDERDYLATYNRKTSYISQTIETVAKWHYGIKYGVNRTWDQVQDDLKDNNLLTNLLSQICLVNIKKTAGGGLVDWDKFDAYFSVGANRERLKEQLGFYSPNIVICGGTAWHLCQIKGWDYDRWPQTSRGVRYYKDGETVYLDFCHPNNRGPKNMIYYALLDALEELRVFTME